MRVTLRSGLDIALDRTLPLVGAASEAPTGTLAVAAPALERPNAPYERLESFFTRDGLSLVAGKAALLPAGDAPAAVAENATTAGAAAVLLYGSQLPAGGIGVDEQTAAPVVALPPGAAARVMNALARGADVGASFGRAEAHTNDSADAVAPFSSTGLAFDGRVKPDLVAPGVGVATSDVGTAYDGAPSYTTVNGSSAAAAAVAGAAAVLAQARPALHASALQSLLVGKRATPRRRDGHLGGRGIRLPRRRRGGRARGGAGDARARSRADGALEQAPADRRDQRVVAEASRRRPDRT